jgi:hypothetical protein
MNSAIMMEEVNFYIYEKGMKCIVAGNENEVALLFKTCTVEQIY